MYTKGVCFLPTDHRKFPHDYEVNMSLASTGLASKSQLNQTLVIDPRVLIRYLDG